MSIESEIFKTYTPDSEKLKKYGFKLNNNNFEIEKIFFRNEFKALIRISKKGEVSGTVFDLENDDEFLPLRIEDNEGSFVAEVREHYKNILTDIREKCFLKHYFISPQANRVTGLIFEKYKDKPLFMWENSPADGVFKNPDSKKWYGIIMDIPYSKLGIKRKGNVEVINLKIDKDKIPELIKTEGIYPAWHMNKKYWISVTLDDTLNDEHVMNLINESHKYTV